MVSNTFAPWAEPVLQTAQDLSSLPEDGWRYELVQGRLVRMPPTGFEYSEISGRLFTVLHSFVQERGLGTVTMPETGFVINRPGEPETVLAPDLAVISQTRAPASSFPGFPRLAPDLVVEIASILYIDCSRASRSSLPLRMPRRTWSRSPTRHLSSKHRKDYA